MTTTSRPAAGPPAGPPAPELIAAGFELENADAGILHLSAGTGQVGAGVAEAPLACFADALTDLDRRLSA